MLRCADGSLYTGITNDMQRRLKMHNAGVASKYTRGRTPVEIVYQERKLNRGLATRREYAIKQLKRSAKETLIEGKLRKQ